ncbi:MAG TPA: HAMP domain-containing sensor histidine kinase, partial [Nitrososphaera sp.]|nr:HAMP domain-containing sensor histidine kinase [Nitrososphaera sp.]
MLRAKTRIDMCLDVEAPVLGIKHNLLKEAKIKAKKKGVKLRYITEINKDNLSYCEELAQIVELRHLDNIRGNFGVSDDEYMAIATIEKEKPITHVIYSNAEQIVRQHQYLFETLWDKAVPAEQKIKEIKEGIEPEFVEVITDGSKAARIIMEFARSVKNEALILMPHSKTMIRAYKLGLWKYLIDAAKNGTQVKIICPLSDENSKIVKQLSDSSCNIKILNGQETESGIFIADGIKYCAIEDKDVNAEEVYEAIGMMIYSNSKKGVNLFKSFFDALWIQMDLYEKLKTHENAQKEFINIAAHELRTPIQPILGFAQVLQELIHKEPERAYIESILRNARRLQTLTEQILDVTRIESHRNLILKKELFDLNESIMTAIEDAKRYNDKLGLVSSTKFIYTPTDGIMVFADKSRIHQVLSNLLANAVKFSDKDGEVFISAERLDNEVVVKVKDAGCGLNPDVLPKLFTKFMTRSDRGTGLGLYISKYIIESHGGIIKGENNKDGKGATFTFVLPLEQ